MLRFMSGMGRFGLVRKVVKASAILGIHALLASPTFGQPPVSPDSSAAPLPGGWSYGAQVCGTVALPPVVSGKICLGTDGLKPTIGPAAGGYWNNTESIGTPYSPVTVGPDDSYKVSTPPIPTPYGKLNGTIGYNPATGAQSYTAALSQGITLPPSVPFTAKVSEEVYAKYRPAQGPGFQQPTPAEFYQSMQQLAQAQENYRLQNMTYQQKLDALSQVLQPQGSSQVAYGPDALLQQARMQAQQVPSQYPASAPFSAQVLTPGQMAAQMGGGLSPQAAASTPVPQTGSSLPPIGAGAYNPPRLPASSNTGYPGKVTFSYDENAPKTPTSGTYSPPAASTVSPTVPNVAPRIPGSQSPTAALRFPR
jgi:hypothetical protein